MLRAMKNFNDYHFIDTSDDLVDLCLQLQSEEWLAVDTEFLRESTYFPKLCLLQIATPQFVACIDTISINEINSLVDLIYNPNITKVMHAARQDMEIFYHMRGTVPQPIFDSQLAAPLLGHPEQIGYAALVEAFLGVHLNKAHTRTDWSHRPLSHAQLQYAADDVRYLAQLYPLLRGKLEQMERLSWLSDDFAALADPSQYDPLPHGASEPHATKTGRAIGCYAMKTSWTWRKFSQPIKRRYCESVALMPRSSINTLRLCWKP